MYNLIWSRDGLTPQKLGAFCEYYAKMTLASYGVDIYTSEVDDHGIDFVAETQKRFFKFQVKAIRTSTSQYVFMRKEHFNIDDKSMFLFLMGNIQICISFLPQPGNKKVRHLFIMPMKVKSQNLNTE